MIMQLRQGWAHRQKATARVMDASLLRGIEIMPQRRIHRPVHPEPASGYNLPISIFRAHSPVRYRWHSLCSSNKRFRLIRGNLLCSVHLRFSVGSYFCLGESSAGDRHPAIPL